MASEGAMPRYHRCYTCGRYLPEGSAYRDVFCSRSCSYVYVACSVCGRYYRGSDSARSAARLCSVACSVRYRLVGRSAVALAEAPPTGLPA